MKNKVILLVGIMVMVMSVFSVAYASTYTSTASMGGNSTLAGKTRTYTAGTHTISIKVKTTGGTSGNPIKVTLNKKGLTGSTSKGTKTITLKTVGQTYGGNYGSQVKGDYYYFFNTAGAYAWSSDQVVMKSV